MRGNYSKVKCSLSHLRTSTARTLLSCSRSTWYGKWEAKRAIERLNSIQDKRENFFKNKVAALMMKPSVVKALNNQDRARTDEPKSEPNSPIKTQPSAKQPPSPDYVGFYLM